MAAEGVIPLFPLGVVLLPGMNLPLFIFEERYKLMVAACLEQRRGFGVVFQEEERLHEIGCTARICRVLRRYPDGRLDILSVGDARFRILDVREEKAWLEALVEPLTDAEVSGEAVGLAARATALLVQLAGMLGRPADLPGLQRLTLEQLSFKIAAADELPLPERQRMLESTSTIGRLERGMDGLERILERLRKAIRARRLTGGNGHAKEAFGR
jgi:Lon protease-like protein